MKTLQTFEVWHTTEFGGAVAKIRAKNFIDCYKRMSKLQKKTFYEMVNTETGEEMTPSEFEEMIMPDYYEKYPPAIYGVGIQKIN